VSFRRSLLRRAILISHLRWIASCFGNALAAIPTTVDGIARAAASFMLADGVKRATYHVPRDDIAVVDACSHLDAAFAAVGQYDACKMDELTRVP